MTFFFFFPFAFRSLYPLILRISRNTSAALSLRIENGVSARNRSHSETVRSK